MTDTDSSPRSALAEERDFFLRSLRDLEAEWTAGDLDDGDYHALKDDYTVRAATVLRRLDAFDHPPAEPEPGIEVAGVGVAAAVSAGGTAGRGLGDEGAAGGGSPRRREPRWKVAVVAGFVGSAAILAVWAVVGSSHTRAPGEVISGQAVGNELVAQLLVEARQAISQKNPLQAVKDYQKALQQDPANAEALTGEGWLLAQTGQSKVVAEGLALLGQAETASPSYALAHYDRGIVLLDLGDATDAVAELQFYLANHPDPTLVNQAQQALAQAQQGRATPPPTSSP